MTEARWAASSGRRKQAQGDQLADGNRVGHQRVWNNIGVGRVKANRWIEVQELAEPRRGRQQLGFDLLQVGLASLQVRGGAVGVGISTLPGHGVVGRQLGDRPCLVEGLEGHGASPFRPEQFTESQRHLQEDLVPDRDVVELALPHELAAFEVIEDYHGRVATEEHSRDVDGTRRNRISCPHRRRRHSGSRRGCCRWTAGDCRCGCHSSCPD